MAWQGFVCCDIPSDKTVEPSSLKRSQVLIDHVSFDWGPTSYKQVIITCKSLPKTIDCFQAPQTDWWMSCLNELWQLTIRCLAVGNLVTCFLARWEVRSSPVLEKQPAAVKSWCYFFWLITDHVSFEWAFTSCNKVFSCKQLVDVIWADEVFHPHPSTKCPDSCLAVSAFAMCLLLMFCLNELPQLQVAASPLAASNLVTCFSTDERCSIFTHPSC